MDKVFMVGVGMVPFGRRPERTDRAMVEQVVDLTLKDAGLTASDVQRICYGNAANGIMTGQEMIRGQVALQDTQLAGIPLVNVENACASSSSAANLAYDSIKSGRCDLVLVLGVEKLSHPTERNRAFVALEGATDVCAGPADSGPGTNSVFVDVYAQEGRAYLAETDATVEDFARVAVKNRRHASLNPNAQYQTPQTIDEVLAARIVVDPLTLPMCSPTTDGAAGVVLCSEEYARRHGLAGCEVLASELAASAGPGSEPVAVAASSAFDVAGVGPADLHLLELHDAAAPAEILQYAEVGLCARGEGHKLIRDGVTELGGTTPVNLSGGLMSRGHPIGATGCAQLVEVYDQLMGRAGDRQAQGAALGMAVNAGGWLNGAYAAAVATILRRT